MKVVGITGLIGSGKSTITKIFAEKKISCFDSDSYVRYLTSSNNRVIKAISKKFPDTFINNKIDKKKLQEIIFNDYEENLKILEDIFHPLVKAKIRRLIIYNRLLLKRLFVMEVPLLFEAQIDRWCDYIVLVKCSKDTQLSRVLKRDNMSIENVNKIMLKQGSIKEKINKADFVVDTDKSMLELRNQVELIIKKIN